MSDQEEGEVKLITNKSQQLNQEISPNELLKKLEIIKDIKQKTVNLQRIKLRLQQELNTVDTESKCLENFQSELDLLFQEKFVQIEELKHIQSDINELELTIKQADEEKRRAYESALRLKNEYKPLKDSINLLRESIGLNKNDDEDDVINSFMQLETTSANQSPNSKHAANRKSPLTNANKDLNHTPTTTIMNTSSNKSSETLSFNQNNTTNNSNIQNTPTDLSVSLATAALVAQQLNNSKLLGIQNVLQQDATRHLSHLTAQAPPQLQQQQQQQAQPTASLVSQSVVPPPPPAFRQQPPPMKACLSCNQQIHRNAPICPLCKAKSRSRNPKKPKKKQNDDSK